MNKDRFRAVLALLSVIAIALTQPAMGADNDVVVMNNGDRLSGELKSLERGKLRFKTAATDTIAIEWDEVARLQSEQNIQIETEEGDRYLGPLVAADSTGILAVRAAGQRIELNADRVVAMHPIEARGLERVDGEIRAGYNFAKASEVQQAQFGLSVEARTEIRTFNLDVSSAQSSSQDNESSQRHSLDFSYRRHWPDRWLSWSWICVPRLAWAVAAT
jgi:small nuclear ribonucleoprotein (snRNP)-like protein